MARKTLNVLLCGALGGGIVSATLGFINYDEKRRVYAARAFKTESSEKSLGLEENSKRSFTPWDSNWDRREPNRLKAKTLEAEETKYSETVDIPKPTATRHIILIRHGQYNTKGETDAECYLTQMGRQQAQLTGLRLKELALPYTHLIHSTMTRARETASLILPSLPAELPVETSDLLREGAPIKPEPPVSHWRPEKKHYFTDGARIEAAFRKYFHRANVDQKENSYEIIVCHANVIRYFVCRAMQFPPEAWLRFSLHHCSMTWVAIRPSGQVTTYLIGDCGHLPRDLLTTKRAPKILPKVPGDAMKQGK